MQLHESKAALRRQIRGGLKAMTPKTRASASNEACARLEIQPLWKNARSILFFAPLPEELDVWPLAAPALAAGKTVALPQFITETQRYIACAIGNVETDLQIGQFGIREPTVDCSEFPLNRLDFVLVPGVAFTLQGRRLGRGKGFYDRLLAAVRGTKCGVAFDEQIVTDIPVEPHDVHLNCILTPTRWIEL
jgi:5-formyltetrahydrofolate cyclo-ligase